MANPTTNYGFVLPTNTDLVTDLPADFEIALQGVDTQMKTLDDANLKKTIIDAAGDLIYGTAADTAARLGLGTAGQVLTVNSGATAPEWKAPAGGGKVLQVLTYTDTVDFTTTSTSYQATGLSGTITLADNTNKVLIMLGAQVDSEKTSVSNRESGMHGAIYYSGSALIEGFMGLNGLSDSTTHEIHHPMNFVLLHSPASTSLLTYEFYIRANSNANVITAKQRANKNRLILMEIEA